MNGSFWLQNLLLDVGVEPNEPFLWLLRVLALLALLGCVLVPMNYLNVLLSRKLAADLEARVGPNRAGPLGLGQPIADFFKLLVRADMGPGSFKKEIWFILVQFGVFSTLAVIPMGANALLVQTEFGALLPLWSVLLLALGTLLQGLSSRSVIGWIGGVRFVSQVISGVFPAVLCLLAAGTRAGGFGWASLAGSQGAFPHQWAIFSQLPFQLIGFVAFVLSGLILLGYPPFDTAFSAPELPGGVLGRLSAVQSLWMRFGRYYAAFFWNLIAVTVYLGAWKLPDFFENLIGGPQSFAVSCAQAAVLVFKTQLLMLIETWVSISNPKLRANQVTDFCWKVLGPASIACLLGAVLYVVVIG